MLLEKIADEGNVYGHDTIEILVFNYDGTGGAIVRYDGGEEIESLSRADLDYVLFGDPGSGDRWYRQRLPASK